MHKILNILDVYKDAYISNKSKIKSQSGIILLYKTSDNLFNIAVEYYKQKAKFEEDMKKYFKEKEYKSLPVVKLNRYKKNVFTIPDEIKYLVYDTGKNPLYTREDINIIITPATYIDPAPKLKDSNIKIKKLYIEFLKRLNITNFIEFGIKDILKLEPKFNNKTNDCEINLYFSFYNKISVIFNEKSVPINGDIFYFKGNSTKNKWFTEKKYNMDNISIDTINEASKYILCKLIGDLLQAYYLKIIIDKISVNSEYALLTVDNNLKYRCILFNIPVIVKNHLKSSKEYKYYTKYIHIMDNFKKMYLNLVKEHNNENINLIKNIITEKHFIINNVKISINTKISIFLNNIINEIEKANEHIEIINDKDYDNLDNYRKELYKYQSFVIFGKLENNYILYKNNTYRLFPGLFKDDDIIYITQKKIDDYIFSLTNFTGGDSTNTYIENIENYFLQPLYKNIDFSDYKQYREVLKNLDKDDNYIEELELSIYYNLLKFETNKLTLYNDLHVLLSYFTLFLDYTGKLNSNDKFVYSIVKRYKENIIHKLTFEEFEKLFKKWYLSVRKPYDDPFLGFIDDNDDGLVNNNEYMDDNNNDNDNDDDTSDDEITPEQSEDIFKQYLEFSQKEQKRKRNNTSNKTRKRSRILLFSPPSSTRSRNKTKKIVKR